MTKYKKHNDKPRNKEMFLERKECYCVGQKHQLINNCLFCGKVVCSLQGQGPCFFCGNNVTRPDTLFPSLPKQQLDAISQQRSKAILHRNKLVQKDKSADVVQNIFDQQLDYYEITQNQWLDEKDRQKAVDRILNKDNQIEQEKLKYRAVFDPLTGQFVRQQIQFDEDKFREQAKNFTKQQELLEIKNKQQQSLPNWDRRINNNQKMKILCEELVQKNHQKKNINNKVPQLDKLIIEDQIQLQNIQKKQKMP